MRLEEYFWPIIVPIALLSGLAMEITGHMTVRKLLKAHGIPPVFPWFSFALFADYFRLRRIVPRKELQGSGVWLFEVSAIVCIGLLLLVIVYAIQH